MWFLRIVGWIISIFSYSGICSTAGYTKPQTHADSIIGEALAKTRFSAGVSRSPSEWLTNLHEYRPCAQPVPQRWRAAWHASWAPPSRIRGIRAGNGMSLGIDVSDYAHSAGLFIEYPRYTDIDEHRPGLTCSTWTNPATPTAAMTTSARRMCSSMLRVPV